MIRPFAWSALAAAVLIGLAPRTGAARGEQVKPPEQTAVFAGGCFWGIEAVFEHMKGVTGATSGYAGGTLASPTYEQVSSGTSGHH